MVDPNRKINRLTDDDLKFLKDCEKEYVNRYTNLDEDFMEHCSKPTSDPPVVFNFGYDNNNYNNRGGFRNNRNGFNNYNRDRPRYNHNRNWNKGDRMQSFNERRHQNNFRSYSRNDNKQHSGPMNIRRDYGNFVAASKDN